MPMMAAMHVSRSARHWQTGRPSRRLFLAGGLAVAFGTTACGRTVLSDEPATMPSNRAAVDLIGDYSIADATTGTRVQVTVTESLRVIRANGLPDHTTGAFPNPDNPNSISPQEYTFELPRKGTPANRPTALVLPQPFGIAVNGVVFDPMAAEWYQRDPASGWTFEAIGPGPDLGLDANLAHVQPSGAYHYHGPPQALATDHVSSAHSPLMGWAGDGFPIYGGYGYATPADPQSGDRELRSSYRLRSGRRPNGPGGSYDGTYTEDFEYIEGSGDLDLANGRFGVTPEYPEGTYYYVLTATFPFVPRYFTGNVAASFVRSPRPGGPR